MEKNAVEEKLEEKKRNGTTTKKGGNGTLHTIWERPAHLHLKL